MDIYHAVIVSNTLKSVYLIKLGKTLIADILSLGQYIKGASLAMHRCSDIIMCRIILMSQNDDRWEQ